jgi:hypothetical protein
MQSDLVLEANYAAPAFDVMLPEPVIALHKAFVDHFARYGLTANDITREPNLPVLAQNSITYNLPSVACRIKFTIAKIEISFFDLSRATPTDREHVAVTALQLVQQIVNVNFNLFGFIGNSHLSIDGSNWAQFLQPLVKPLAESVGAHRGAATVYYYGPSADRVNMALIMDSSAKFDGALFLRIVENIDGERLKVEDVPARIRRTFESVSSALDLQAA